MSQIGPLQMSRSAVSSGLHRGESHTIPAMLLAAVVVIGTECKSPIFCLTSQDNTVTMIGD